jgi:hypothetical protein
MFIGEPLQGFNLGRMDPIVTELETIFKQVKDGDHILAQYASSNALMTTLSQFHFEGKSPAKYAEYGLQLMKDHPHIFASIKDFYELECFQFISGDEQNTVELFKRYLIESVKSTGLSLYYICCFFPKIIRRGEYEWTKKYIEKFFPYSIGLLRKDVANHYWYILTMYNVYTGNYREGETCLQEAFAANTGQNRNVNSDIILRCYDVFFAAMHGDPMVLQNTVTRQMRYAQRHHYEHGESYQMFFLKAVSDLVKYIGFNKSKAEKVRGKYLESYGVDHFSFLFQKIYGKFFQ